MTKEYLISVITKDNVGIIANISGTIEKLKGNLGQLREHVLGGYLSMILLAEFPVKLEKEEIENQLGENFRKFSDEKFSLLVWPSKYNHISDNMDFTYGDNYILTACPKDRKGLVADISAFCSKHKLNILNLNTQTRNSVYNMIFILKASNSSPIKLIREELKLLEEKLGTKLMFQHYRIFKATNEIKI
ncbi:MAG TPA: hypothetical protein DD381_13825 [Lentisphaeria bacterium]|nr:MAG: hypothetical protein A2X47_13700 [Lentisphaerae bacterium GWF2_38_69]HBM17401.1 hypothetical protein [Lentisphaeria bacterium]